MHKMVKYAHNNVQIKIIGLAQNSREMLKDDDVPIFTVVLSTPDYLQLSLHHHCDRTGITLSILCVEVNEIVI